ncbi:hypothetical protein PROFUN_00999 [Planoprotostelium fungivorum]|uniref:IPT/TIG domain-containing protein n=1 Tax=Planoprotostelium fungivorum TaxID=1890364 RepID=A0A2P6N4E5_9EUKA|nr:hypothetical protein PROFUN_00999 [Planoprotostelium fungivorum]
MVEVSQLFNDHLNHIQKLEDEGQKKANNLQVHFNTIKRYIEMLSVVPSGQHNMHPIGTYNYPIPFHVDLYRQPYYIPNQPGMMLSPLPIHPDHAFRTLRPIQPEPQRNEQQSPNIADLHDQSKEPETTYTPHVDVTQPPSQPTKRDSKRPEKMKGQLTKKTKLTNSERPLDHFRLLPSDLLTRKVQPGPFFMFVQPDTTQRKCYRTESRYIIPNPVVSLPEDFELRNGRMTIFLGDETGKFVGNAFFKSPDCPGPLIVSAEGVQQTLVQSRRFWEWHVVCASVKICRLIFSIQYFTMDGEEHEQVLLSQPMTMVAKFRDLDPEIVDINPSRGVYSEETVVWMRGRRLPKKKDKKGEGRGAFGMVVTFDGVEGEIVSVSEGFVAVKAPRRVDLLERLPVTVDVRVTMDSASNVKSRDLKFTYYGDDVSTEDKSVGLRWGNPSDKNVPVYWFVMFVQQKPGFVSFGAMDLHFNRGSHSETFQPFIVVDCIHNVTQVPMQKLQMPVDKKSMITLLQLEDIEPKQYHKWTTESIKRVLREKKCLTEGHRKELLKRLQSICTPQKPKTQQKTPKRTRDIERGLSKCKVQKKRKTRKAVLSTAVAKRLGEDFVLRLTNTFGGTLE